MSSVLNFWYEYQWWQRVERGQRYKDCVCYFDVINCSVVGIDGYVSCTCSPGWNITSSDNFYIPITRVEDFEISYIIVYDMIGPSIKEVWGTSGVSFDAERGTT